MITGSLAVSKHTCKGARQAGGVRRDAAAKKVVRACAQAVEKGRVAQQQQQLTPQSNSESASARASRSLDDEVVDTSASDEAAASMAEALGLRGR